MVSLRCSCSHADGHTRSVWCLSSVRKGFQPALHHDLVHRFGLDNCVVLCSCKRPYHLFKQSFGPGESQLMRQHALALFGAMGTTAVEKDTIYERTGYGSSSSLLAWASCLSMGMEVDSCIHISSGQRPVHGRDVCRGSI